MNFKTLIFSLLSPFLLSAQSIKTFNLTYSPNASLSKKNVITPSLEVKRIPQLGHSFGASIDINLLPEWNMRLGLDYSITKHKLSLQTMTAVVGVPPIPAVTNSYLGFHFIDCPITIIYAPKAEKIYYGTSFGLSFLRKSHFKTAQFEGNNRVFSEEYTKISTLEDQPFSPYLRLLCGYNCNLNAQNTLSLEPFVNLRTPSNLNPFDAHIVQFSFGISALLKFQVLK